MASLTLSISLSMLLLLCGTDAQYQPLTQQVLSQTKRPLSNNHSSLSQRVTYRTYSNARYGYSIAYPAGLLIPQGESDNGDGQKFVSKNGNATLLAFGSNRLDRSLADEFQSAQANRRVTYKVLRRDMFVVSGTENGKIFYQKTLLRGDVFKTFIIEYDDEERATFDSVTSRIARSFVG